MECDLAVERRFGLEYGQEDFSKPMQSVGATVRSASMQGGSQRVSKELGSIRDRYTPDTVLCYTPLRSEPDFWRSVRC